MVLYFAYGANTDPAVLRRRSVNPSEARPASTPKNLYHICFRHRAGYATVLPGAGTLHDNFTFPGVVHGVLYDITGDELHLLKRAEEGYTATQITVVPYDNAVTTIIATAFQSHSWNLLPSPVKPTLQYRNKLLAGAIHYKLHPDYIRWLESLDVERPSGYGLPRHYYDTPFIRASTYAVVVIVASVLCAVLFT